MSASHLLNNKFQKDSAAILISEASCSQAGVIIPLQVTFAAELISFFNDIKAT